MAGPDGVGQALRSLRYWELRQDTVAHNLANVSTPGFKGERVFARYLESSGPEAAAQTDFSEASLAETGRPLDLALVGDGFLVVDTPEGERLVRGGSFSLDPSGAVVSERGETLLAEGGPLVLPPGPVEVSREGVVSVEGARVGRLRVALPEDRTALRREGGRRWLAEGPLRSPEEGATVIRQGQLEESNVDPVGAMVEMMEIQRAYSAVQRSVQVNDRVMETITTEIGRVG